jgi:hypothetical protein
MARFFDIYRNRTPFIVSFLLVIAVLVIVSFTSIYGINRLLGMSKDAKNKLIPAVVTAEIAEFLTENRLYIEEHIASEGKKYYENFENAIHVNYRRIDSLLTKYNEEYTQREAENRIGKYREKWRRYKEVEQKILYLSKKEDKRQAQVLFLGRSVSMFQELVRTLGDLTNKHVAEGEAKYSETQELVSYIKLIVYSAIGIAFLIVILLGIFMALNFYQ